MKAQEIKAFFTFTSRQQFVFNLEDLLEYGGGKVETIAGEIPQSQVVEGHPTNVNSRALDKEVLDDGDYPSEAGIQKFNDQNKDALTRLDPFILDRENYIFTVDNHNHALAGFLAAYNENLVDGETALIHVDAHRDSEIPEPFYPPDNVEEARELIGDGVEINEYLVPAIEWGVVDEVEYWGAENLETSFFSKERDHDSVIVDVDLDVFNNIGKKVEHSALDKDSEFSVKDIPVQVDYFYQKIAEEISNADFTTIATSPGYIHQDMALKHLDEIMNDLENIEEDEDTQRDPVRNVKSF